MKNWIALIMSAIMILSFAACGSTASETKTGQSSQEPDGKSEAAPAKSEEPAKTEDKKEVAYTIDNEVIVDNEYCAVTLVSVSAKKSGGADLKFTLENKTEDKDLMFSMDDTAVNGWLITSWFAETVAAGKKSNETLSFSASDLEDLGLKAVDKLEFYLRVYDSEDWLADNFVEETFVVYPTGLGDAEVISPERRQGKDEMAVVDNDACVFTILDTHVDSIWGYTVTVYLENKTEDTDLMFSWSDVSVNGYMVDPFWAASVSAGNKRISSITFSSSKFEENGIEDVDEIEFELRIHDDDDWLAEDIVNDTFTYTPTK